MKHESFEDLVSLYFDDALDSEGIAELNRLLTRPEFAARFVHLSKVHGGMRELSAAPAESTSAPARRIFRPWIPPTMAAAAFLVLIYALLSRPSVKLEDAVGAVKFDGKSFESPALGSATIVLKNGTRLMAGSETTLRIEGDRIELDCGRVAADMTGQSSKKPLVISTPQAEAQVLDTRLSVSVDPEATFCSVEAGHVRLIQKLSNKSIEVPSGFFAIAAAQGEVKAEKIDKPAVVTGAPAVRVVAPLWPKAYKVSTFHKGSLIYGDRGWRITEIPSEVDGAQGIVTVAEDKSSQAESQVVFDLDREADVWVGIDGRAAKIAKKIPTWLASWEATALQIHSKDAGNTYYHLYRRRFPAGTVSLGGNHLGGDTGAKLNYTVLITAPGR